MSVLNLVETELLNIVAFSHICLVWCSYMQIFVNNVNKILRIAVCRNRVKLFDS